MKFSSFCQINSRSWFVNPLRYSPPRTLVAEKATARGLNLVANGERYGPSSTRHRRNSDNSDLSHTSQQAPRTFPTKYQDKNRPITSAGYTNVVYCPNFIVGTHGKRRRNGKTSRHSPIHNAKSRPTASISVRHSRHNRERVLDVRRSLREQQIPIFSSAAHFFRDFFSFSGLRINFGGGD